MEQVDTNRYRVKQQEHVIVRVRAVGVIQSGAVFVVDGQPASEPLPGQFEFDAGGSGSTHFALLDVSFPPGTAAEASYSTEISGSLGGTTFGGPRITASDHVLQQQIRFEVR